MTPTEAQNLAAIASILIWCSTAPQAYYTWKSRMTRDNKFWNLSLCVGGLTVWTIYALVTYQWVFVIGDGVDGALWGTVLYYKIKNMRNKQDSWK